MGISEQNVRVVDYIKSHMNEFSRGFETVEDVKEFLETLEFDKYMVDTIYERVKGMSVKGQITRMLNLVVRSVYWFSLLESGTSDGLNVKTDNPCETLTEKMDYSVVAERMRADIRTIKDRRLSDEVRRSAALDLRQLLDKCALDDDLNELTVIYKNTTSDLILGYDPVAVARFANRFREVYGEGDESGLLRSERMLAMIYDGLTVDDVVFIARRLGVHDDVIGAIIDKVESLVGDGETAFFAAHVIAQLMKNEVI